MMGGKRLLLLLLAECVFLGGCQSQKVSFHGVKDIHIGDLFYLSCEGSKAEVSWYHNGQAFAQTKNQFLKIPVATQKHSGVYHCGAEQDNITINIKGYYPRASLSLETGQPVMHLSGSVTLRLRNDEGLKGWNCLVFNGQESKWIALGLQNGSVSFVFQTRDLRDLESTFWCTNSDQTQRSNHVTIRTSDKKVAMEMYFAPALAGEDLILRCINWDMDKIAGVAFYKNDEVLISSSSQTYKISSVKDSDEGAYKCDALFTNNNNKFTSDKQELIIQDGAIRPVVSSSKGTLSCSCPSCPSTTDLQYTWYIADAIRHLELPGKSLWLKPKKAGFYACEAAWNYGRTSLSKGHKYAPMDMILVISVTACVVGCFVLVLAAWAAFHKSNQRRSSTGPVYEDVGMKTWEDGDDRYQRLAQRGTKKDSEYDTLHTPSPDGEKKEQDYQPLVKARMDEPVYHTLGVVGVAAAAVGGYEELQRKTMKEEIYHGIGMEGAAGGEQK